MPSRQPGAREAEIKRDSPAGARFSAAGLVVASAFSAQLGAALVVRLFAIASPATAAFIRNLVGAAALMVLLALRRGTLRGVSVRAVLALGVILGVMNASFYYGIARLPLGDAVSVEFMGPIVVAALTSAARRDLIWVALAALGVVAISHPGPDHLSYAGLGFILTAAACWGAYIVVGGRVATGGRRAETLAAAMTASAALLLLPALTQSAPSLLNPAFLGLGAAVGILSSAIPYSVELVAMARVPPTVFGVLLSLQPLMAAVMGFLVLGQRVSALEAIGFVLVVSASIGATLLAVPGKTVVPEPVAAV
ncbi:MAG TPA: EamA family transporter [Candidatus Dormibacteraeota bacterium]|nr:EamA family transporter [Candidatus Dormibacteraeota bacterium]